MLGGDKLKYRMMWEALKDTAEVMIEDGIGGEVSWRTLLGLVQQGEKMQSVDGASKTVWRLA